MNIIIAGSRDFDDYDLLKETMTEFNHKYGIFHTIISGCANGADKLGEKWATDMKYEIIKKPADWEKHGKAAGPIRNAEMAAIADMCVLFWDGKSKGTRNMLENCLKDGIPVKVVRYNKK